MYSTILSVGAYALLLSNLIATVILLRNQFKQWRNTSLYILSTSDVFFSVLTSSVLFLNYMEIHTDRNKWNNILSLNNTMQNQENDNDKNKNNEFQRFYETFSTITNGTNFTAMPECNMTNVIMKYGMLFFPFTNSFVSLLIFSIQCNLNLFGFKHRCFKFLESQRCVKDKAHDSDNSAFKSVSQNMNRYKAAAMGESSKVQIDSKSKLLKQKNLSMIERCRKKFLQAFNYNGLKKDNKIMVGMFVMGQWIIPILVTGLLYLAEYDIESYIKDIENIQCFNENMFFDNCENNIKSVNITPDVYSEMYSVPFYKDYVNDKDLVRSPNTSNTQVNEIISKVQNVVYSILNNTYNTSYNVDQMHFYNTSELLNITKQLEHDKHVNIMHNSSIRNAEVNLTENVSWSNIKLENDTNEHNSEFTLFNSLMINSLKNISLNENNSSNDIISNNTKLQPNNTETIFSTETQPLTDKFTEITTQRTAPVISNEQIYVELVKRIHNITSQYASKKHYKNNHQSNRKQPKHNKLEDSSHTSTTDQQNVLLVIKTIYQNDNTLKTMSINTIDTCFISIQFLKLHLIVLVFVIYFLPILFSAVLQQHGKLNCRIVLNRLKIRNDMPANNSNINFENDVTDSVSNNSTDSKEGFRSTQTSECIEGHMEELGRDYSVLDQIGVHKKNSGKKWSEYVINEDDRDKIHLNAIKQVQNILTLFDTIKISLLCGTLLWTPILIEILFKVFVSSHVPGWLLNITYMSGITFGILRNIFNLKMIKLQETDTSIVKTNSIHPIDPNQS